MVEYIVNATYGTGYCNPLASHATDSSVTAAKPPTPSNSDRSLLLGTFIFSVADAARIDTGTLVSTVVYLARLQKRLSKVAPPERWSGHHLFLSVLVLAHKYQHDVTLTNEQWAECSRGGVVDGLSAREITWMELQMLCQLDWDLRLPVAELYAELDPFLSPIRQQLRWLRVQSQIPFPTVQPAGSSYTGQPCREWLTLYPRSHKKVPDELSHENS
jgi:hypothetical protein